MASRYAVAQISDLHVVEAGRLLADAIDTADYTRRAVAHRQVVRDEGLAQQAVGRHPGSRIEVVIERVRQSA